MIVTLAIAGLLSIQDPQTNAAPSARPVTESSAARPSSATPADPGKERVCRREHVIGSNRPQRICMTRDQWARQSEEARDQLNRGQQGRGEDVSGVGNAY